MLILEGQNIYDDKGGLKGKLELQEGERAGPFIICESSVGALHKVDPTLEESTAVITEADGSKYGHLMVLEGRFQMADTVNRNGRVYPEKVWDKVFEDTDFVGSVDGGEMLSEQDHPVDGETRLSRVVGRVTKLWRNPNNIKEVMGRLAVFDNEAGRNLKAIHEGGGRLGVSSRGTGSVVRLGGKDVVQEDFKPKTWDVVHGPSTPGAYPEEVTESYQGKTSVQETEMTKRLEEIASRLHRLKEKNISSLSRDARELVKESVEEIQNILTEENFGNDSPKAAKLVTEATNFIRDIKSINPLYESKGCQALINKAKEAAKNGDWDSAEGHMINCRNLISQQGIKGADYAVSNAIEMAKKKNSNWFSDRADDVWKAVQGGKVTEDDEVKTRPTDSDSVTEAVSNIGLKPLLDVQEALRSIRSAYRDTFSIEGPLSKDEIRGINEAAKKMVEKAEWFYENSPTIKATIRRNLLTESVPVVVEANSEAELYEKINESTKGTVGSIFIEVDRSEKVYSESAKRFKSLIETQVIEKERAVRDLAENRADLSELSAKLTGAKRLIEAYAIRCKHLEKVNKDLTEDTKAACTILDEIPREFSEERLKGTIEGIAVSNPHIRGITESLSKCTTLTEAFQIASYLGNRKTPTIEREPFDQKSFDEAVQEDKKSRLVKLEESKTLNNRDDLSLDLTDRILTEMRNRGSV